MRKILLLIIGALLLNSCRKDNVIADPTVNLTGNWEIKQSFGAIGRHSSIAFTVNNKAYFGTGFSLQQPGSGHLSDLWEWNQTTNTWAQMANFGGGEIASAASFSINNSAFVISGLDTSGFINSVWEFIPASNSWVLKSDFPGNVSIGCTGFSINGKGYIVAGGDTTCQNCKELWEYDTTNDQWTRKSSYPGTYLEYGFVIGGNFYGGNTWKNSSLYSWNPVTNIWTPVGTYPGVVKSGVSSFSMGTKGYLCLGVKDEFPNKKWFFDDIWEWDQVTGQWTQKKNFPGGKRGFASGFSLGPYGYVCGGFSGPEYNELWQFTP